MVGMSSYFWIIRVVNSQLALYRHVICNPLDTPKTPPNDNKISTLTGDICLEYQYTKLGRWTYLGRWTPQESSIDIWNTPTPNLADKPTLADGTPTCWMAISHCYWHLLLKNGNWQIYAKICQQIYPPNASWDIYYGMYLAAILYSARKDGDFLLFLNNWVVKSQLALYSHVRCNPSSTPPETPPNTPHMTITNFNYENSYLPGVICNIVVKDDLGRSPGRCTPTHQMHLGIYFMG